MWMNVLEFLFGSRDTKLLYSTKEASERIGCDENWLASRARAGLVPYRTLGKYRYFSMSDIEAIIDNSLVPVVHTRHDGQGVATDTKTPRIKSIQTRKGNGDNGD